MEGQEHRKFVKYVKWCYDAGVECHPNVLCQELEKFPETLDFLKNELTEGRISLDLHGWTHGPYQDLPVAEIEEHLDKALDWFAINLAWVPLRWVTPHGSDSPAMRDAAAKYGLPIETCEDPVIDQKVASRLIRESRSIDFLDGKVIMSHWWERGLALYRVTQCLKHGGLDEAIEENKHTMDVKSYNKCWNGWMS
jgi:peptidoglycan/xylan/chitin deacetylase (PgdA/CDA1 family)